jgi:hypothetical protein
MKKPQEMGIPVAEGAKPVKNRFYVILNET